MITETPAKFIVQTEQLINEIDQAAKVIAGASIGSDDILNKFQKMLRSYKEVYADYTDRFTDDKLMERQDDRAKQECLLGGARKALFKMLHVIEDKIPLDETGNVLRKTLAQRVCSSDLEMTKAGRVLVSSLKVFLHYVPHTAAMIDECRAYHRQHPSSRGDYILGKLGGGQPASFSARRGDCKP